MDLVSAYREYFKIIRADTDLLRAEAYRIRNRTYCLELSWEKSSQFPFEQEIDSYDTSSIHTLLLYKKTQQFIGCVRIVIAAPETGRPAIPLYDHHADILSKDEIDIDKLPLGSFGEISRLAVVKNFRQRRGEDSTDCGLWTNFNKQKNERRQFPLIVLGLYMGAATVALYSGLDGVFTLMEPRLARRLNSVGVAFQKVGSIIDHRGVDRAPYYLSRQNLFSHLSTSMRELFSAIAEDISTTNYFSI